MHVVGGDAGDEPRREEQDDGGERKPAREQLRPDGEDEHEAESEEDLVR